MLFFTLQFDNDTDRAFFSALYEKYEKKMFHVALGVCGNQWIAEDAVHDAFCKAANHFDEIKSLPENRLGAWLLVVCKNSVLDILRKESRISPMPETVPQASPETPETQFAYKELVAAIRSLPNQHREILELKLIEGLSHQEIANSLGISNTAARLRLHRAKQMLTDLLRKGESYEVK